MESIDNIVFTHEDKPVAGKLLQKDIVRMQTPNAFLEGGILAQQRPDLRLQCALLLGQLEEMHKPALAPHGGIPEQSVQGQNRRAPHPAEPPPHHLSHTPYSTDCGRLEQC